jgi:hypothetical protein
MKKIIAFISAMTITAAMPANVFAADEKACIVDSITEFDIPESTLKYVDFYGEHDKGCLVKNLFYDLGAGSDNKDGTYSVTYDYALIKDRRESNSRLADPEAAADASEHIYIQLYEVRRNYITFDYGAGANISDVPNAVAGLVPENGGKFKAAGTMISADNGITAADARRLRKVMADKNVKVEKFEYHFVGVSAKTAGMFGLTDYSEAARFYKVEDIKSVLEKYIGDNSLSWHVSDKLELLPDKEVSLKDYLDVIIGIKNSTGVLPFYMPMGQSSGTELKCGSADMLSSLDGDTNNDGETNMADAVLIMQSIGNPDKYKLSEQGKFNADVDGAFGVTNKDALRIQQYKLGLIDNL